MSEKKDRNNRVLGEKNHLQVASPIFESPSQLPTTKCHETHGHFMMSTGSLETSDRQFREILGNLPKDLDSVYDGILGGSPTPKKAKRILHIIVVAA